MHFAKQLFTMWDIWETHTRANKEKLKWLKKKKKTQQEKGEKKKNPRNWQEEVRDINP